MKLINTPFLPVDQNSRFSRDGLTLIDALRIYFTILFGVSVFVWAFYYVVPQ